MMSDDVEHFFLCLLVIHTLLIVEFLFIYLTHWRVIVFLSLNCGSTLCIPNQLVCQIHTYINIYKIFVLACILPFHFINNVFLWPQLFNLDEIQFSTVFFYVYYFGGLF